MRTVLPGDPDERFVRAGNSVPVVGRYAIIPNDNFVTTYRAGPMPHRVRCAYEFISTRLSPDMDYEDREKGLEKYQKIRFSHEIARNMVCDVVCVIRM